MEHENNEKIRKTAATDGKNAPQADETTVQDSEFLSYAAENAAAQSNAPAEQTAGKADGAEPSPTEEPVSAGGGTRAEKDDADPREDPSSAPADKAAGDGKSRIANFFYYHKWHLLAAAFILMVIVVCSVQTCRHTGRDYTLMYAGPKTLSTAKATEISNKVAEIAASLEGETKTAELHHYFISLGVSSGNAAGVSGQNLENFDNEILTGQSVILLISPDLYRRVTESNGGLLSLDSYVPADMDPAAWYDDSHCAVKLSAVGLSSADGFRDLPSDTLLCLRSAVSVTGLFRQDKAEKEHLAYERLFCAMVAYRPADTADGQ